MSGIGMASTPDGAAVGVNGATEPAGAGVLVMIDATGALGSGTLSNGCVFAIFTAGGGGAAGSGRMVMRAVSFFGLGCAEPG